MIPCVSLPDDSLTPSLEPLGILEHRLISARLTEMTLLRTQAWIKDSLSRAKDQLFLAFFSYSAVLYYILIVKNDVPGAFEVLQSPFSCLFDLP